MRSAALRAAEKSNASKPAQLPLAASSSEMSCGDPKCRPKKGMAGQVEGTRQAWIPYPHGHS